MEAIKQPHSIIRCIIIIIIIITTTTIIIIIIIIIFFCDILFDSVHKGLIYAKSFKSCNKVYQIFFFLATTTIRHFHCMIDPSCMIASNLSTKFPGGHTYMYDII